VLIVTFDVIDVTQQLLKNFPSRIGI